MADLERLVVEELRGIVETLERTQDRLTLLRAVLPPESTEHAVVGCCQLDRLAPLIEELGALTGPASL
jgi:hypothetical protein